MRDFKLLSSIITLKNEVTIEVLARTANGANVGLL